MDFVEIARFSNRLEAETIAHALDPYGIPYMVRGEDVGLFGTGQAANIPGGASIWIPRISVEEVRDLLDCVLRPKPADDAG